MQGSGGPVFGDPLGFGEAQEDPELQDEPLGGPEDVHEPPPPAYDSVVLQSTVVRPPPPPACRPPPHGRWHPSALLCGCLN